MTIFLPYLLLQISLKAPKSNSGANILITIGRENTQHSIIDVAIHIAKLIIQFNLGSTFHNGITKK